MISSQCIDLQYFLAQQRDAAIQLVLQALLELEALPSRKELLSYLSFIMPEGFFSIKNDGKNTSSRCCGVLAHWRAEALLELLDWAIEQGLLKEAQPPEGGIDAKPCIWPTEAGFLRLKQAQMVQVATAEEPVVFSEAPNGLLSTQSIQETNNPNVMQSALSNQKEHDISALALATLPPAYWQKQDMHLYEQLRALRTHLAKEYRVRHYHVATNAVLCALVEKKPSNLEQMRQLHGVGERFMENYAAVFLDIIVHHLMVADVHSA